MSDRLVVVGTGSARSDASAEDIALRASSNTEAAALAAGTLIDDFHPLSFGIGHNRFDAKSGPIGPLCAKIVDVQTSRRTHAPLDWRLLGRLDPTMRAASPGRFARRCHHSGCSGPQPRSDDTKPTAYHAEP